jgi:hypothetical protein
VNSWIDLQALWQIVVVGLLAGEGLPALFAVGLRALSIGRTTQTAGGTAGTESERPGAGVNPLGLVIAIVCFAIVVAAVGWGIYFIVHG